MKAKVTTNEVQMYWEENPLCAAAIPFQPGTLEFFKAHNDMRRREEPEDFQRKVYEFDKFRGKNVLDIGCGIGYVVALYASHGANVTGVDIAHRSVELTRDRLRLFGLQAKVQQANAESLPFPDNSFDLVTSYGVLHHTPDTQKAVDEAYRVLKPGGRMILMFYNKNSFAYRMLFPLKRILQPRHWGKQPQQQVNEVDGPTNPLGKVYSKSDLSVMMKGLDTLEFSTGSTFFNHEDKLPAAVKDLIINKYGWCLYAKGNKARR